MKIRIIKPMSTGGSTAFIQEQNNTAMNNKVYIPSSLLDENDQIIIKRIGEKITPIEQHDYYSVLKRKQEEIVARCVDKEVEELTQEEKVAICFCNGAPMRIDDCETPGHVLLTTTRKVGIAKLKGKFRVFVANDRPRGMKIDIPGLG